MMTPSLNDGLDLIRNDVTELLKIGPVLLGQAKPPSTTGVYMLLVDDTVMYAGKADGKGGLSDRLRNKHISGDEGHAIQRAYEIQFPDRMLRRAHKKATVSARWLPIEGIHRVRAVERVLIWLYNPPWNKD